MATDVTRNTTRPFAGGSAASIDVTSSTTLAPAGISAPLVPWTGELTVAVILSPGRLLSVQTRAFDVAASTEPAPTAPELAPPARSGLGVGCGEGSSTRGGGGFTTTRLGRSGSRALGLG